MNQKNTELYYKISEKFKRIMKDVLIYEIKLDDELILSYNTLAQKIMDNLNSSEENEDTIELLKEYNNIFNVITIQYKLLKNENIK
jgi:hypothetical protein